MLDMTADFPPAVPAAGTDPVASPLPVPAARLLTVPLLARLEFALATVCTLLCVFLHFYFCRNVGALWRDEVSCINVATAPTFGGMWDGMGFELLPVVYFTLLRGWAAMFGADNDTALRILGLLIGLAIVGASWLNARQFGVRWPLFSLVLLGCNPLFVRYADSTRAYGLGIVVILLTVTAVWRALAAPRVGRVLLAMVAGVVSVQTLYGNPVLLFAVCVAAAFAAARERRWRAAAVLLAVGVPAALSLVTWVHAVRLARGWNMMLYYRMTPPRLWDRFSTAMASPDPSCVLLWGALLMVAPALAFGWLRRRPVPVADPDGVPVDLAARTVRFSAMALVIAVVGHSAFVMTLNYSTPPWHYIACLAVAAVCLDALFGRLLEGNGAAALYGRAARLVLLAMVAALTFLPARGELSARQTNIDSHARQLNEKAVEGDLIVCSRWECAITLARYYHGKAALVTLPPLDDHRCHRFDLVLAQMMTPNAVAPVLARMEATLRAGHRVWMSGPLAVPINVQEPSGPSRARIVNGRLVGDPEYYDREPSASLPARIVNGRVVGDRRYYVQWAAQATYLLFKHAETSAPLLVSDNRPVVEYEWAPLTEFAGWH